MIPNWILIQIGLLILWIILPLVYYFTNGWRTGFPFKKEQVLKLLFFRVVPIGWMSCTLISGIIYFFITTKNIIDLLPIVFMIVLPLIVLTSILYRTWRQDKQTDEIKRVELLQIKEKRDGCLNWIHQFTFIDDESMELKIYMSRGTPVGKLTVYNVTQDQESILLSNKGQLPLDVHLETVPKIDSDNNGVKH
ncbi:hypothetical protein PV403_22050 [Paenibacillus sp. GYB006]|uniref:hypothetical protein n=1 Tax=Paenibacillus sp. GYB006 TaxID=2994394 RepID=UPI002F965D63